MSEFGRTFRENGTRGTDHGHGSVYWVLGGAIQGGRMAGEQVAVRRQTLNQNRDFPVLTEYRALLGGLFKRMYCSTEAVSNACFRMRRRTTSGWCSALRRRESKSDAGDRRHAAGDSRCRGVVRSNCVMFAWLYRMPTPTPTERVKNTPTSAPA